MSLLLLSNNWVSCCATIPSSFASTCCLNSLSQNVLHSSPKIRYILEFVLMYATISCWWQEAEMSLISLLRLRPSLLRLRPKVQITINFEVCLVKMRSTINRLVVFETLRSPSEFRIWINSTTLWKPTMSLKWDATCWKSVWWLDAWTWRVAGASCAPSESTINLISFSLNKKGPFSAGGCRLMP